MNQFSLLLIFAVASLTSTGCALKAPLVTDALPITKIKGANGVKAPVVKPTPRVTTPPATSVTPGTAPIPAVAPTPAVVAPAEAVLDNSDDSDSEQAAAQTSALTGTQTYYFSGSNNLPPLAKALQIQDMSFRSLLADPADQSEDARKNNTLVDQCPDGRSNLDFIQSVAVGVRHSKEADSAAVVVATYAQTKTGLCGFHLTPTNFDMKDYASDYVFVIQVTGTLPPQALSISGYYTAQDYEGI